MLDGAGRPHDAEPPEGQPPFDAEIRPGEYIITPRFFRVHSDAARLGVVVGREGNFGIPRDYIIGQGPFHKAAASESCPRADTPLN